MMADVRSVLVWTSWVCIHGVSFAGGSGGVQAPVYTVVGPVQASSVVPIAVPPAMHFPPLGAAPPKEEAPEVPVVPDERAAAAEEQAELAFGMTMAGYQQSQNFVHVAEHAAYTAGRDQATKMLPTFELEAMEASDPSLVVTTTPSFRQQAAGRLAQQQRDSAARAAAMSMQSNDIATKAVIESQQLTDQAVRIATRASEEQAKGKTEQAMNDMVKAYDVLHTANARKAGALKFRKFAENLNTLVPVYNYAADAANASAMGVSE